MKYRYELLSTDVSEAGDRRNDALLGESTLGVEVTSPALAARCGLGNIDPQHSGGGGSSAIEQALTCPLPPEGALLVTIRPDKDSFGAMAVLMLRAEGLGARINKPLVSWIGAIDRMGFWKAKVACPELFQMNQEGKTNAIQAILNGCVPEAQSVEAKVAKIGRIILEGGISKREIQDLAALKVACRKDFAAEMRGPIAFIVAPGGYNEARNWGGQRYAIVLVFDPSYGLVTGGTQKRWSLLLERTDSFDRRGFEERINCEEARARGLTIEQLKGDGYAWGGPPSIVSSPMGQGRDSVLPEDVIIRTAQRCANAVQAS